MWNATNSQSNPGAMMELRVLRKQRSILERALAAAGTLSKPIAGLPTLNQQEPAL